MSEADQRARRRLREKLSVVRLMPNLVTILGLCAGLSAIRFTLDARFEVAAALIIFAALLDAVDGLVARSLNAASAFGAELDSLADFVNFGVAPGILVFGYALHGDFAGVGWIFVLVYTVCACLRLARFNITRDAPKPPGRQYFVGVPAPAGALLALFPVFLGLAGLLPLSLPQLTVAVWIAGIGMLMVSTLATPSIKGLRVSRDRAVWVMIGAAFVVGLGITRFWLLMVLVCVAYLLTIGALAALQRRVA